ncbi:hypothetical protein Mesil_1772 [Allomeiothermus silvanus DSM 9946]|uniref:Holin n=1 Tax=Allomeiothermus silvanus (strain ATCC 700542 / DSM 9946 / NBRC 106475 / NCIMB 13440 / VI-R2) TaxID=526227 RepID=D7BFU7_ALLS1|nr:hypothetical protein [Allomeiothermus silvanus]ADH63650.1 hypothetical protein Mesil_1772 [Allomeiothermus silvanus DSM 9946]
MDTKPWYMSKTVWAALLTGLLGTYQGLDAALNDALPNIPQWVFYVLTGLGLYGLRTADKKIG